MRIPYGPWEPDSAGLDMRDQGGRVQLVTASGVYPNKAGYIPISSLQDFGRALSDGNDSFTKVLLQLNSIVDASTTITDTNTGGSAHTWTAAGNAQLDTADFKWAPSSLLCDGTGDYVTTADHADFTLGSGNWTADLWFKVNGGDGTAMFLCGQSDAVPTATTRTFHILRSAGNVISAQVYVGGSATTCTGTTIFTTAVNTGWHHVALVRSGNTIKLFVDGVQEGGDQAISGSVNDSTNALSVGRLGEFVTLTWNGWIDEFRLSVGVARWTANFTPPTQDYSSFALPSNCIGGFAARTSAGGWRIFAGTATKLYQYDSTVGWKDVSRVAGGNYGVPVGDYWSFAQFGSQVIAVNITDDPQVLDIDTGAVNFSALGGSPPKAKYVAVVGDFVILACIASFPLRIQNSAINSTVGWTAGVNLSDTQDFPDGGSISGLAGGEFGWVTQERAIRRMIFQPGNDQAFRFERVERERGAISGYSLTAVKDTIYFLADDGFYAFGSQGLIPIGHQRINQWFRENSDPSRASRVLGFTDPYGPRVIWAFYGSAATTFDQLIIYDWQLDQWSHAAQPAQFWIRLVTASTTLEGLNIYGSIDTGVPFSLDSPVWQGGIPVIAAVSTFGRLAFLNGATPINAQLLTSPQQLTPAARSFVQGVEPIGLFNSATVTLRVGKREHTKNPVVYSGLITPSTRSGIARVRSSGRVHQFEQNLSQTSGTMWKFAEGIDVDANPDGTQ